MVAITEDKTIIVLERNDGIYGIATLKKALFSLLINLNSDKGETTDSLIEDIQEVSWLLKSLELSDEQALEIENSIKNTSSMAATFTIPS